MHGLVVGSRARASHLQSICKAAALATLVLVPCAAPVFADDGACRATLEKRVKACAQACIDSAKAAVDPEVRGRILGYGCTNNCAKLEMFNGHTCSS